MRILRTAARFAVLVVAVGCGGRPETKAPAATARPDSTVLPDLAGQARPLSSYSGANGLLVVFADTRCPFSAVASSEMPTVATGLAEHGVGSVLVNLGEPLDAVTKVYGTVLAGVPVVYDTGHATGRLWGAKLVPTALLLDSAGSTVYRGSPVWADVGAKLAERLHIPAESVKLEAQGTSGG